MNYQGDLQPNSFHFGESKLFYSIYARKPLFRWLTWRVGGTVGSLSASDSDNRDYLKPRNLSFKTSYKELHTGFELNPFDLDRFMFTPYAFFGVGIFRFNPWALDQNENKVYLQPLNTEGQGLPEYPDRKPYKLTQASFALAYGVKYALSDVVNIGMEFHQRKTGTDYIDDVSTKYVAYSRLLEYKGPKAVEMAYRGGELPNGDPYPSEGEIRGTPTEMDWVYYFGLTVDIRFGSFSSGVSSIFAKKDPYNRRCPKF